MPQNRPGTRKKGSGLVLLCRLCEYPRVWLHTPAYSLVLTTLRCFFFFFWICLCFENRLYNSNACFLFCFSPTTFQRTIKATIGIVVRKEEIFCISMTFKNYFTASARRTVLQKKGRANGRPTAAHFNRFVRQPFHERTLTNELAGGGKYRTYNVFDSRAIRNDLRNQHRNSNAAHLTSQNVLRQIKAEKTSQRRLPSPSRKCFPFQ